MNANAERAADDDTTIAYLGELDYGASAVSVPITNDAGILQVSAGDGLTSLTREPPGRPRAGPARYYPTGVRNFLRLVPNDLLQAETMLEQVRASGAQRLAVVFDQEIYGRELAGEIVARARRDGPEPVRSEEYRGRVDDIPDIARSLADDRPDAVVFAGVAGPGIGRLLAAIDGSMPGVPVFATSGMLVRDRPIPAAPGGWRPHARPARRRASPLGPAAAAPPAEARGPVRGAARGGLWIRGDAARAGRDRRGGARPPARDRRGARDPHAPFPARHIRGAGAPATSTGSSSRSTALRGGRFEFERARREERREGQIFSALSLHRRGLRRHPDPGIGSAAQVGAISLGGTCCEYVGWHCSAACSPLFALTVSACGDDDDGGGGGGGGEAGGTLNVYSSLPLQGASRPQTTAMVEGIRLALEQADSKAGDFTIKYTSLDDSTAQAGTWTPEAASANARKVAQDDSAIAYIGEFNSGASAISIPILNEGRIAQISPANTYVGLTTDAPGSEAGEPEKFYPTGNRNYLRIVPIDTIQGAALASLMKERGLWERLHPQRQGGLRRGPGAEHRELGEGDRARGAWRTRASTRRRRTSARRRPAMKSAGADCFVFSGITANGAVQLFKDVHAALPDTNLYGPDGVCESGFSDPKEGGLPADVQAKTKVHGRHAVAGRVPARGAGSSSRTSRPSTTSRTPTRTPSTATRP